MPFRIVLRWHFVFLLSNVVERSKRLLGLSKASLHTAYLLCSFLDIRQAFYRKGLPKHSQVEEIIFIRDVF